MIAIEVPPNLSIMRDSLINISDIEFKLRDFYLSIPYELNEDDEQIAMIINAEGHLNSAINLVWNLFKSEGEYITEDFLKDCEEKLGRVRKHIRVNRQNILNISTLDKKKNEIHSCFSIMDESIKHLCFYPFKNGLYNFKNFDDFLKETGDKIIKDTKLFLFCVFREFYSSVSYLGGITSEDIKTQTKIVEVDSKSQQGIPVIPPNVNTEKKQVVKENQEPIEIEVEKISEEEKNRIEERKKMEQNLFGDETIIEIDEDEDEDSEEDIEMD